MATTLRRRRHNCPHCKRHVAVVDETDHIKIFVTPGDDERRKIAERVVLRAALPIHVTCRCGGHSVIESYAGANGEEV